LRVGHPHERAWIDADELNEKASDTGEHQIRRENLSGPSARCAKHSHAGRRDFGTAFCGANAAFAVRAHVPEPPRDDASDDEFVNGSGVNALHRGDQSVREAHAPGQGRRNSVVAVSGEQAADSANAVSERGGRRARIK